MATFKSRSSIVSPMSSSSVGNSSSPHVSRFSVTFLPIYLSGLLVFFTFLLTHFYIHPFQLNLHVRLPRLVPFTTRHHTKLAPQYNLPQLLNISTILNSTLIVPPTDIHSLFLGSLADRFMNREPKCTLRTLRSQILTLFSVYPFMDDYVNLARQFDTLTVQFCGGTETGDFDILRRVENEKLEVRERYRTVLFVPCSTQTNLSAILNKMESTNIFTDTKHVIRPMLNENNPKDVDGRMHVFNQAHNLVILHSDSDSALAALVSIAPYGIYINESHPYLSVDWFKHSLKIRYSKNSQMRTLDGMGAVLDSCCSFSKFGDGDGTKMLCENSVSKSEQCWVLSIGCANRWSFEKDVILRTNCTVHVFDCTGDFTVPPEISNRVTVDKICIGDGNRSLGFRSYDEIVSIAVRHAGLPINTAPQVLKMDVEGWEFPVLTGLIEKSFQNLPKQLVVEIHTATNFNVGYPYKRKAGIKGGAYAVKTQDVKVLLNNLREVGYRLVHRADNPHCKHCSEITVLLSSALPNMQ